MAIDACLAGLLWTPRNPIDRLFSLGGVLALPVLIECVRRLGQPRPVFHLFQQGCRRGIRSRVLRRIAQGLEQPGRHQHRNVIGLAIQHPEGWHGALVIRPARSTPTVKNIKLYAFADQSLTTTRQRGLSKTWSKINSRLHV